jgi:outer membrane protein assembly factor BamB
MLYAVAPDGTAKWNFTVAGGIPSSLALGGDDAVYVPSKTQQLYALNPNGTERWTFVTQGGLGFTPAIGGDGTVYWASSDKTLYAVNPDGTSSQDRQVRLSRSKSRRIWSAGTRFRP